MTAPIGELWRQAEASGSALDWSLVVARLDEARHEYEDLHRDDPRLLAMLQWAQLEAWETYAPLAQLHLDFGMVSSGFEEA